MAEYGTQSGQEYSRNPIYGRASSSQRDAAYSSIFGAAPPAGRSQNIASQPAPIDRAQTAAPDVMRRMPPVRQQINGYPPQPSSSNASSPSFSESSSPPPIQRQPQPQFLPQPLRIDRRPYGVPQRLDSRGPVGASMPYSKAVPERYPGGPPPALNADAYRSQSLAMAPRPMYQPPGSQNIIGNAQAQRQPQMNHLARTTAQGRVVPERPDERTMSLSSYSHATDHAQTMSGRIIPNRRRPSRIDQEAMGTHQRAQIDQSSVASSGGRARLPHQNSDPPSRTLSTSSTLVSPSETATNTVQQSTIGRTNTQTTQSSATMILQRRAPLVYPALLSRVADTFRERIQLAEKEKNGLVYKSAFTGAEAVDIISTIIKTTDRNLALLLGRSLDAQKFFHDVTYDHRLRDSQNEVYQFRETLLEDTSEVNGVFTLLTECYSPTCTRDSLCYSIACPRRLEQQALLNMKIQPGLKRQESRSSLHDDADDEQKLWINTVSKEVADSINDNEKKRQEVISELMYTERDFVKDLEYLRDFWMKPLRNPATSPIPEHRREKFIRTVFSNCQEVYMVNSRLADALTRRQQASPVVRNIGDIFLEYVTRFSPFIKYGANQLFGKYEFEKEKASNLAFSRFVDNVERLKESRKLELNGYLTKPTTRLARYPLLLENVAKFTADDNPDKYDIPKTIKIIRDVLYKVNVESGKAENHFNLMQLNQALKFRPGEFVDLKLTEESRQLIFKGPLKKGPTDAGDIQAYLFDHAVLLVKIRMANKREEYKVHKKPIPLELLVIPQMDDFIPRQGVTKRPSSGLLPAARAQALPLRNDTKQQGFPITFKHLGKGGYEITLYCATQIQQQKWMEHIDAQQKSLKERSNIFTKTILNEGFFTAAIRVNCCVPIDGGRKLVFGTDFGIYVADRKPKDSSMRPKRALDAKSVTQIDVLEQYGILLVLADRNMYSYPMEALDPEQGQGAIVKRGKKIGHVNFFKVGVCVGQHLVAIVKSSANSTVIRVYEPMDAASKNKKKSGFAKMLVSGQDVLKLWKEIYIGSDSMSIHFLRTKLCVGCAKGFEVVSLDTLDNQSLLDEADTSLDFVARKENIRPIHIERLASEFLLCYSDFSFFVNRNGWRARPDWKITWEGNPQAFAIFSPYILAFEPNFIEIRHMETGMLMHILTAKNVRMLHSSTREILYAYEDESGDDIIASLDFWGRPQSPNSKDSVLDEKRYTR